MAGNPENVEDFRLPSNYPNPFNPGTSFQFELKRSAHIELAIYDVRGRLIRNIAGGFYQPGVYKAKWNGFDNHDNPSAGGGYFIRMRAGDYQISNRILLLR